MVAAGLNRVGSRVEEAPMVLASSAYALGQLFGIALLVFVGVGIARTFARSDLSLREKILGKRR